MYRTEAFLGDIISAIRHFRNASTLAMGMHCFQLGPRHMDSEETTKDMIIVNGLF
jgi:hypothetical protein